MRIIGVMERSHIRINCRNHVGGFRRRLLWWGVSLVVLGVFSGFLVLAAVTGNLLIAWLIVLSGLAQLIVAHHAQRAYSAIWKLIVGFAYVLFGVYLIAYPVRGLVSLTMVLAPLFLFEGVLDILVFYRLRRIKGSSWVLLKGTLTVILGVMFHLHWPSIAKWATGVLNRCAIGVLVGMSLFTSGVTLVMLSLASHEARAQKSRDDPAANEYWQMHS